MQSTPTSGAEKISVLVADDTRIHTQLLADALRRDLQLEVINPPAQSRDLVATVKLHRVNVVVLSSNLDEEPLRGFELLRELRVSNPDILAIMLLDSSKKESVLQAFRAGARGIFTRHDSVETLSKCIRSVYEGQIWANSQQMGFAVEALATSPVVRAMDANGLSLLSKREMDVVRSLAEGLTNREIAERLGLSQHTIKNYLFRVYDKLGVSNRLELLFMTLTQPGGAQSIVQAAGISANGHRVQRLSRLDTVARGARPGLANNAKGPELPVHVPDSVREEIKLQKQEHEGSDQTYRATTALPSSDPLD
jgi:two-component system, NarL family, nitrate/nitrite response regulator NarL